MAAGIVLFVILGVIVVIVGGFLLLEYFSNDSRKDLRSARNDARLERKRASIATKALRSIANGAGNPLLEAQDALDQINNTYDEKELN